ncbi:MAG TPA: sodium:alanine symporter family protein [Phycisphaerales bacterium]|nr:sodium:alanine symporter family protein [Phycisphaerales bacterium]HIB50511.1 sodium:alanine symporter family protein [Phycisphaerales bacterium]HIN84696.1 sodium:alanine symporter family protein [Phycisphaerales bacterium]HIO52252.1 sodium:alanine symporter family protein [Phycisphaerales bacterium]
MEFTTNDVINAINGIFFHDYVVYALLATGVLFTLWTGFGQYRALTHGVDVTRGKYDKKDDPGAISHFQALSAALSATIGLGNIAGVALAIALGGPGAVFWMWVIGLLGMALKMTEVTQSMLSRDLSDPDNPHGGPMYVVDSLFKKAGGRFGATIGGIFCLTLILSAITGGNMFQAWNVAAVTTQYFDIPGVSGIEKAENGFNPETFAIGILLAIIVGSVIIGGIKRIGSVASKLVPFMCGLYLIAGIVVLLMNISAIPAIIMDIFKYGLGFGDASAGGAFIGGTFGYAMMWGIKRALFSSEAGQGSAPVAHAAAKCKEPVREGIVAGIGPFVDTLVVCTVTALIILATGAWNRGAEASFADDAPVALTLDGDAWHLSTPVLPHKNEEAKKINQVEEGTTGWSLNDSVFMMAHANTSEDTGTNIQRIEGTVVNGDAGELAVKWKTIGLEEDEDGNTVPVTLVSNGIWTNYPGASLTAHAFDRSIPGLGKWLVVIACWLFAISTMISWSYYGEQGVIYIFGKEGAVSVFAVTFYRLAYTVLVAVSTIGFIETDAELDMWTTLGLGAMLVANIPIMWVYGPKAMRAYHEYIGKLKRGEFKQNSE